MPAAALPSVLFMSACELNPENIIEKVFNKPLPSVSKIDDNISAYRWFIDNKYYTTNINLCNISNKCLSNEEFASTVNGIVIAFDAFQTHGLEEAEKWLPYVNDYEAEIKMLVCLSCPEDNSTGASRRRVQEWCIQRGYELIELDPNDEVDPDDDFPETTGVERIRQALHAHQWSNLVMKDRRAHPPAQATDHDENEEEISGMLAESLEEMLENDSFGDLFSQLTDIKEQVNRLSGQARQEAAEQVVRAFWHAIGGDEDEL